MQTVTLGRVQVGWKLHDRGRELACWGDFIGVLKRISARNLKNTVCPSKNSVLQVSGRNTFENAFKITSKSKFSTPIVQFSSHLHPALSHSLKGTIWKQSLICWGNLYRHPAWWKGEILSACPLAAVGKENIWWILKLNSLSDFRFLAEVGLAEVRKIIKLNSS